MKQTKIYITSLKLYRHIIDILTQTQNKITKTKVKTDHIKAKSNSKYDQKQFINKYFYNPKYVFLRILLINLLVFLYFSLNILLFFCKIPKSHLFWNDVSNISNDLN